MKLQWIKQFSLHGKRLVLILKKEQKKLLKKTKKIKNEQSKTDFVALFWMSPWTLKAMLKELKISAEKQNPSCIPYFCINGFYCK